MTSGKKDEYKGRMKEAAGDLTDDERLQEEGQDDQTSGKVKQKLEDVRRKGDEMVDRAKEKVDKVRNRDQH